MNDEDLNERLRVLDRRQEALLDRLDLLDTARLQRLERLNERPDVLAGQTGQVADDLVDHHSNPHAHDYGDTRRTPRQAAWSAGTGRVRQPSRQWSDTARSVVDG